MKFRLQHESEIHGTPNILLKSFRRKKGEKTTGKDLMKTMAPVQTAWYVKGDTSENVDKPAEEDVSSFELTTPATPPTTNVLLKSFRRKKSDTVNNNYLKSSSAVKTSWYVDADVGGGGGDDDDGEVGVGGGGGEGEGGERWVPCALLGDGMVGKTSLTVSYTQHLFNDRYTATVFDNYPVPVQINGEKYVVDLCDTAGQSDYESLRTSSYESSEVLVLCFSVCDRESFHNVLHSWVPEIQRHAKGRRPLLLVGTQIDLRASSSSDLKSSTSSTELKSSSHSSDLRTSNSSPSDTKASNSSPSDLKNANSSPKDLEASKSSPSGHRTSNSSSSVSKSSSSDSKASNSSSSNTKTSRSSSQDVKTPDSSSSERRVSDSSSTSSCLDEVTTEEGRQLAKVIGADCYIECSARSEEGVQQVFEHVVFSALKYRKKKNRLLSRLFSR